MAVMNDAIRMQGSVSPQHGSGEAKRSRRRRGRRKQHNVFCADDCASVSSSTTASSSSDDSSMSRQRTKPNKKKHAMTKEEQSRFVAMDCEMVGVGRHGKSHVARVTILDWNQQVLYDRFVRPSEQVTDYRTFVSGVTAQDLQDNDEAIDLDSCRQEVANLLQDKILVGHALKNDLAALGIQHPWHLTRDTAKFEPFMKVRFAEDGIRWPRKLKELCAEKLQKEIQPHGQPHSSYEDAAGALQLYKLVRVKWEKTMQYKIHRTEQILGSSLGGATTFAGSQQ